PAPRPRRGQADPRPRRRGGEQRHRPRPSRREGDRRRPVGGPDRRRPHGGRAGRGAPRAAPLPARRAGLHPGRHDRRGGVGLRAGHGGGHRPGVPPGRSGAQARVPLRAVPPPPGLGARGPRRPGAARAAQLLGASADRGVGPRPAGRRAPHDRRARPEPHPGQLPGRQRPGAPARRRRSPQPRLVRDDAVPARHPDPAGPQAGPLTDAVLPGVLAASAAAARSWGIVGVAVGVAAALAAWVVDRRRRTYTDVATTPAAATSAGHVELKGRAWAERPLSARRTETPSVWWDYELEEERVHTRTVTSTDSQGRTTTRTETYKQWHTIVTDEDKLAEIEVVDDTGAVTVRLGSARVVPRQTFRETFRDDGRLGERGLLAKLFDNRTGRYRETERAVAVGD